MPEVVCCESVLNMTSLALKLSHYINGVAKKHGEVARHMCAHDVIAAITNGVQAATWTSPPLPSLFDQSIPGWREDNVSLRYALSIPKQDMWNAHRTAKRRMVQDVNRVTQAAMEVDVLTLGFARRATAYKRLDLLFQDRERLQQLAAHAGGLQVIYAGKAPPRAPGEGVDPAHLCGQRPPQKRRQDCLPGPL